MRLVLGLDGVTVEFVEPRASGPYRWLTGVGSLLLAARAGHLEGAGVGESANVTVELNNDGKQASTLLGRPLRARAWLYDDDDELLLAGLVASVGYGRALSLTLEV